MITKKQYEAVLDNHVQGGWVKFTNKLVVRKWISKTWLIIIAATFLFASIGTWLKLPRLILAVPSIIIVSTLLSYVINMFVVAYINKVRDNKIMKELGINSKEYGKLIQLYGR